MPDQPGPESSYSTPEAYFFEADRLINAGDANEAYALLQKCVAEFPDFGKSYNHLGFIQETKYRDPKQAEVYYQKCLELSPDYQAVYLNYSVLLSTQERHEELEALLEKALLLPGINKAKIYNEYAIMYEVKAQYETAIEFYRKAVHYSFVGTDLKSYEASIERVQHKQRLLN